MSHVPHVLSTKTSATASALLAMSVLAWALLVWLVVDMDHPVARLMMPATFRWNVGNMLAVGLMWATMMAAMMLPSAWPMVRTFVKLGTDSAGRSRARNFVAAYLLVWCSFSLAASVTQWILQALGWLNPVIASTSAYLTGALLLIAGIYQFSPLKRVCLSRCRSPMGFLLGEWRAGTKGAFVMGLRHGLFCLGCCWALMALLFVGGVMNLMWVAALSIVVAVEKLAPCGQKLSQVLGIVLISAALFNLLAQS